MRLRTQHVLLRDRRHWLGRGTGVAPDRDGVLRLRRVPGPADGRAIVIDTAYPAPRDPSGLTLGPCGRVFVADTAGNRVWLIEPQCASRVAMPGFAGPRGLALAETRLWIAEPAASRIAARALPALDTGPAPLAPVAATSLAIDTRQRLLYVDPAAARVRRVLPDGTPDTAFDAAIATGGRLAAPIFVAVAADDDVLVSDAVHNRVDRFDADGAYVATLSGPAGWLPGAIAAGDGRVYVADAADGRIRVFAADGTCDGALPRWRGPVSALALAGNGDLYVKPGLDADYRVLDAGLDCVAAGELVAGPFDAGVERDWARAWCDAETPPGTTLTVAVALAAAAAPPPAAFQPLPGHDALLELLSAAAASRRYLWLRATLSSADGRNSPALRQLRAATAAEDLRDFLPATYRRNDPDGVLQHLLELLHGEFAAVEEAIDDAARVADPDYLGAAQLSWLAQWLGLELPRIADDGERRALIAEAIARRFPRRGTPASIADFVALHTGIRPAIVESFAARRLWVLGESSRLGFDTMLPPLDPLGMVVPDPARATGCCPVADGEPASGRAVVGESGPLAAHQIGLPLFAEDAYRFCVVVDAYRVANPATLAEIRRIVEREKPAHTDYRIDVVAPMLRIGLQATVGVDAIVGGPPPAWQLGRDALDASAYLMPADDAPRVGEARLDGSLHLT